MAENLLGRVMLRRLGGRTYLVLRFGVGGPTGPCKRRLARNPIDGGRVQWLLQSGALKAIITSDKIYLPTDNVIQMAVEFGMSTQYSIDLGKDVKRGMLQKLRHCAKSLCTASFRPLARIATHLPIHKAATDAQISK